MKLLLVLIMKLLLLLLYINLCYSNYINPVIHDADNPDPGVIYDDQSGTYIATTTTGNNDNAFKIHRSEDLVNWSLVGYIFPNWKEHVTWAISDFWAPEIHKVNNKFIVYYVARHKNGVLSIGAAVSSNNITGPYIDIGRPLYQNLTGEGAIDPTYYDGYLIFKDDGNARASSTPIYALKLEADGISYLNTSVPTLLISNDLKWEGPLVEAPWLLKINNIYYLFYSAQPFNTPFYSVGVARSKSILGPYEKFPTPILHQNILHNNTFFLGTGHCSVIQCGHDENRLVIVYHAYKDMITTNPRVMMVDRVYYNKTSLYPFIIDSQPSTTLQQNPCQ